MSRTVVPMLIPSIWVCTAPATPTVQRSELDMFIVGVIADGGGDSSLVVVLTALVEVDSVIIVSSAASTVKGKQRRSKYLNFICSL
ncbi:hypothetical protein N9R80_00325 [bacterium]|nr:hypothetical protein [bacterium]